MSSLDEVVAVLDRLCQGETASTAPTRNTDGPGGWLNRAAGQATS